MATYLVTGAGSGIGAATVARLTRSGADVLGVDLTGADITADLSTPEGRAGAVAAASAAAGGRLAGVVCCAGVGPLATTASGSAMVSVNYFGTVDLLTGLRPALAAGDHAAAVVVSSSSTTTQPAIPADVVAACLAGDEPAAVRCGAAAGPVASYPATKLALAHWVRRSAGTPEWIGAGIRLNAVAPGMIDTPMTNGPDLDPELARALDFYPVPLGRRGQPDEIASVIEFLLGPGAALLCGSVIFADGGTDAHLRGTDWPAAWEPTAAELGRAFTPK
ncbi:SDR family oxidoreductase [Skermania piniformis]|uniref:SDR family oxidoreductase n=1 Tax=Skermania pinensis TaxID=39122 RepID=A0ABX8S6B6_9ACTN|nr:SDR family oxidoreductase [Skermania piniformis]QXQ13001.1 SDR family oxidoreductase [Skermania piniformis]